MNSNIDIDLIKDVQNPMYQNLDIHRQRLISVLDRSLEKICIAYVLEEMLTKYVNILPNYISQRELESILHLFRYIRRLEEGLGSIRSTVFRRSTLFKRSTIFKSGSSGVNKSVIASYFNNSKSNVSINVKNFTKSPSLQLEEERAQQEQNKANLLFNETVRSYYSTIIARLLFSSDVTNLAKYIIRKKSIGTIKYYIYLKDLRDHVIAMIYQTKTDEMNHKKNIKRAYVKNLKEIPQVKVIDKILKEKQKEKEDLELQIRNDIQKEKLIQTEMNLHLKNNATGLVNKSEEEILARSHENYVNLEVNKVKYAERTTCYHKKLDENLSTVLSLRKRVKKLEVCFKKILEDYDNTIGNLHEDYEIIYDGYVKVEALYNDLQKKFEIQEEIYIELMKERDHFTEMTCLRIRYNKASKIVQRWWRAVLARRWKWRKTYLAAQLKRKSLSPDQRAKMKKSLKKALAKQKRMNKKK